MNLRTQQQHTGKSQPAHAHSGQLPGATSAAPHWRRGRNLLLLGVLFALALPLAAVGRNLLLTQDEDKPVTDPASQVLGTMPELPHEVRTLLQDRKYAEAQTALDAAMTASPDRRDQLQYLKGRAFALDKKYDEAIAAFRVVEESYASSPWVRQARFAMAIAYMRKGDYHSAEQIYRTEAEYLLGAERKQEIAGIYLEFADLYFHPEKETTPPDYSKARTFYLQALEVGPAADRREQVELRIARCSQQLGEYDDAVSRYDAFIKAHPEAELAAVARFRLGESYFAQGNPRRARRTWQDLLAKVKDGSIKVPATATAAAEVDTDAPDEGKPAAEAQAENIDYRGVRMEELRYRIAQTYGVPSPANAEALDLGVTELRAFLAEQPNEKLAPAAQLMIAQSYSSQGRWEDAVNELQKFLANETFAASDKAPAARVMLGMAYQSQKKFPEALAAWTDYLARHPADSQWTNVQRMIIDTEYLQGFESLAERKFDIARNLWTDFLRKHPLEDRCRSILFDFGRMEYLQNKYEDAIHAWRDVVSKYPGSNEASRAQYMIAVTLETHLHRLEDALKEYAQITYGQYSGPASARHAALTRTSMGIATTRVFRTDEDPAVELTSRNVKSVDVSAYRIDLETYFRKMHLARGVEDLDVALIDPDRRFKFEVPEYQDYQQFQTQVSIRDKADGAAAPANVPRVPHVMAVTVASDKLEATTLVIQSDLDLVVKSSRDEVFVFAQNMRTGEAWPGVRLLISDGATVFAEAETGADGVFQGSYKELASTNDVRVFGIADGHVASNVIDLNGVGVAQGLANHGYLYTDRPVYRAGQFVHVRGVIRNVQDDRYAVDQTRKYTLEVFDPRGRSLGLEDVQLDEFGAFHSQVTLPEQSVQGPYRLALVQANPALGAAADQYAGEFTVQEYKLEPVQLTVDAPRSVYYRGEVIEGEIVARYYYGAPVAGKQVTYNDFTGRSFTATTDAEGRVPFKLETRELDESQVLTFHAEINELAVGVNKAFVIATQGYSLAVSSSRANATYLAGETFEATVKAQDAEGKPAAEQITLSVLKRTRAKGTNRVGETMVESHELTTDEKTGQARVTLKMEDGAQYVLRASGTDRFDKPVTSESVVNISDDRDGVRLRILAEKHSYKVGDTAKVNLHWREAPALALVTFQGAKVLSYRLVHLNQGDNPLEIPMSAELAPNFQLAVAVMRDVRETADEKAASDAAANDVDNADEDDVPPPPQRFHAADSPFTVERDLRVTLETRRAAGAGQLRPGEDVEVAITTTDAQGQPVSAELSLGMVEQALADRFGRTEAPIADFFRGQAREAAVRTTSSIVFDYYPTTRPINADLLSETERREIAAAEGERLRDFATSGGILVYGEPDGRPGTAGGGGDWSGREGAAMRARRVAGESPELLLGRLGLMDDANSPIPGEANGQGGNLGDFQQGQQAGAAFGSGGQGLDRYQLESRQDAENQHFDGQPGPARKQAEEKFFEYSKKLDDTRVHLVEGMDAVDQITTYFSTTGYSQWAVNDATVLFSDGKQANVNFKSLADNDPQAVERLAEQLIAAGAVIVDRGSLQETGYWNPKIVTDAAGKATVTISLPDRSTAWRLQAKGITTETLAGEAETDLKASKELFGELKLPAAFTSGDLARIGVTVHNQGSGEGVEAQAADVELELKTTIANKTSSETRKLEAGPGVTEIEFPLNVTLPAGATVDGAVEFELIVRSGDKQDVIRRSVPLTPYGEVVFATASGAAESDTIAWINPDERMPLADRKLEIIVGPSVEQNLMDIVLGPATPMSRYCLEFASGHDATTSELMAALALRGLAGGPESPTALEGQTLDARVHSAISALVASQSESGAWTWSGRGDQDNPYATAQAVWALAEAKQGGYRVPDDNMNRALNYLANKIVETPENDYETKAVLLHAMAAAGRGDFALANRLHRNRPSLSSSALAHLSLALVDMNRTQMAAELLDLLGERNLDAPETRRKAAGGSLPWSHSPAELHALFALALQAFAPGSPQAKEQVDWLMAHRQGARWAPEKATGPATMAVAAWYSKNRYEHERYTLKIFANNSLVKELEIEKNSLTQRVEVPTDLLAAGKQQINFELTGRGRFAYQCVLSGFVPADKLISTTQDWRVRRRYEPAPLEFEGERIPRGFDVAERYQAFNNPLTQLPQGERGIVELSVWRNNLQQDVPDSQLEYLVVTEPLPSGVRVMEDTISGGFERYEISGDAITFFIGNRRAINSITFQVHGYLPGEYKAAPTIVRDAYRPDMLVVADVKTLNVLASGEKSTDEYRLSPRELYELGTRQFNKQNYAEAAKYLDDLFANWTLRQDIYRDTALKLLEINLKLQRPAEIVRLFEIVKERWPDEEISYEKILRVAQAYEEVGEYERAYLVYRATVEGSFLRESRVPGFLESQNEFVRSVKVMDRLVMEYPPEPYVAAATYYLAQRVYAKAPSADTDEELRKLKLLRVDLVRDALTRLENFLTYYPDDPAAAQAAFSAANALLELDAFRPAIAACQRYAERYADSEYLDSFWYVIGYCHFALGEHEQALQMCEKVAEATRKDPQTGRETESPNKLQAVYIMGQVHHSLGEAKAAIEEYEKVKEQFADAAQAIEYFMRKEASLPEVSLFQPGEGAKVSLKYRNVAELDTKVFRIDLTKFGLLRRDLDNVTKINLAGIKPLHETTAKLGDGKDYADKEYSLDLPLDEEGAYLVVCRADDLHATGLVLVTPLKLDVQEEQQSGRVRATVKDEAGKYLKDVHVKVIGSRSAEIVSGETDLRGVFVADNLAGHATVIAQADGGRYAFFRGETELGPPAAVPQQMPSDQAGAPTAGKGVELLDQLKGGNSMIQEQQRQNLQNLYDNKDSGVKAKSAY